MDRFAITNDLLTGADDIDAQHRQLFHLANSAVESAGEDGSDRQFFAALAFLSDYIQYHFAAEESAMAQSNFPEQEQHRRAHLGFREEIGELVEASLETSRIADLRQRLHALIAGWLTAHIRETDKILAAHLRRHALDGIGDWPSADELLAAGVIDARAHAASVTSRRP
jgi:hemerythrin